MWNVTFQTRNTPLPETNMTGNGKSTMNEDVYPITLPETNIAPKNGWLEYYFPIGDALFSGANC